MGLRLGSSKETVVVGKQEAFTAGGSYGENIPYCFGTRKFEGKSLWFAPIEELVTKTVKRKKGPLSSLSIGASISGTSLGDALGIGSHKITTITYDYYATFAVWFCVGPAQRLSRLWLDDLLVYEGSPPPTDIELIAEYPELEDQWGQRSTVFQNFSKQQESRIPYKLYLGTEDQEPDPTMTAIEGIGEVPAHKGLVYMVFDRLKLEQFKNQLPKVTAEIVVNTGTNDIDIDNFPIGVDTNTNGLMVMDWKRGLIYSKPTLTSWVGVMCFDLQGNLIRDVGNSNALKTGPTAIDMENNDHFGRNGNGGDRYDTFTGALVYSDTSNTQPIQGSYGGCVLNSSSGNTSGRMLLTSGSPLVTIDRVLALHNELLEQQEAIYFPGPSDYYFSLVTPAGQTNARFGYCQLVDTGTGLFRMYRADAFTGTFMSDFGDLSAAVFGLDTFDFGTGGSPLVTPLFYDEGNDRVVGFVRGLKDAVLTHKLYSWSEAGGVEWATTVPFIIFRAGSSIRLYNSSRLVGGRMAWTNGAQIIAVNLADGTISDQYDGVNNGYAGIANDLYSQTYDDATNRLYLWNHISGSSNDELQIIELFIGDQTGSTLADIVRKYAADCGLIEGDDFDVSEIEAINVPGFITAKTEEARKVLDPLMEFYQVNVVDRDHRIYFETRQTTPLATITINDMVADRVTLKRDREEESQLPRVYEVEYVDRLRDYEKGIQRASRTTVPIATMGSKSTETFSIDIALYPTEAKQQVEKLLYSSWIERNAYSFSLPQKWLRMAPGDLVTLQQPSGFSSDVMFDKIGIGANFEMRCHSVEQTTGMYISVAKGATGNWTFPTAYLSVPSEPFLLDIPLLMDSYIPDQAGISVAYWAASDYGVSPSTWPGAFIYRSYDNAAYDQMDVRKIRADWGVLKEALGEPVGGPFASDYVNVVKVFMNSGTLAPSERNVSLDDILTGLVNRAVICHADGTFELLYFETVTEINEREVELSGLLRGRRGTDTNLLASAGDRIVFLSDGEYDDDTSNFSFFANPIADTISQDQFYRVVTRGLTVGETETDAFSYSCADLKPYAPDHVECEQDTMDDIIIQWVRRTRFGGEMEDLVDVPLSEDVEAYEVDIYDPTGVTVLRTLTSSVEMVTYAAADVLTDQLVANPTSLKVGVYQMNAAVGRGFGRIITIEV